MPYWDEDDSDYISPEMGYGDPVATAMIRPQPRPPVLQDRTGGVMGSGSDTQRPTVAPAQQRARDAYSNLDTILGERPAVPQPKGWQRALAGVAAGVTGYANAGGRIRPVDPNGVARAIEYGNYPQRVAQWQQRLKGAEMQASLANQQSSLDMRQQEAQGRIAAEKAREDYYDVLGKYRQRQGTTFRTKDGGIINIADPNNPTYISPQWHPPAVVNEGESYFDPTQKKYVTPNPKPTPAPKPESGIPWFIRVQENPGGYSPDIVSQAKAASSKATREPADPAERANEAAEQRYEQQKTHALSSAASQEAKGYQQAEGWKQSEMDKLNGAVQQGRIRPNSPEYSAQLREIANGLRLKKQSIRNAYEQANALYGSNVQHIEYPDPLAAAQHQPPVAPGPPVPVQNRKPLSAIFAQ